LASVRYYADIQYEVKTRIITSTNTTYSVSFDSSKELNFNTEYRLAINGTLQRLSLSQQSSFYHGTESYHTFVFKSGATPTTIVNSFGAYFTGDDCMAGTFTPVANKTYDVGVWWNGFKWQGVVRGSV
jgi:hypothetical protein